MNRSRLYVDEMTDLGSSGVGEMGYGPGLVNSGVIPRLLVAPYNCMGYHYVCVGWDLYRSAAFCRNLH